MNLLKLCLAVGKLARATHTTLHAIGMQAVEDLDSLCGAYLPQEAEQAAGDDACPPVSTIAVDVESSGSSYLYQNEAKELKQPFVLAGPAVHHRTRQKAELQASALRLPLRSMQLTVPAFCGLLEAVEAIGLPTNLSLPGCC